MLYDLLRLFQRVVTYIICQQTLYQGMGSIQEPDVSLILLSYLNPEGSSSVSNKIFIRKITGHWKQKFNKKMKYLLCTVSLRHAHTRRSVPCSSTCTQHRHDRITECLPCLLLSLQKSTPHCIIDKSTNVNMLYLSKNSHSCSQCSEFFRYLIN